MSGLRLDGEANVRRRISGVSIGGVSWKVGHHCLYVVGEGGSPMFGSVVNMFHGKNDMMDEFVIFELDNTQITRNMGHYCLLSSEVSRTVFVMWNRVTWKCKLLYPELNIVMGLPFKSCSDKELMEFR
jgi:hypothetical protein